MIKSELVLRIAEQNPHLYQRGFGAFSVKKREARTGRNPRTGETVSVAEKIIPVFKTGKEMRMRLNASNSPAKPAKVARAG